MKTAGVIIDSWKLPIFKKYLDAANFSYYEHNHINWPGVTFVHNQPPFWVHVLILPYGAWLHAEHHEWPNQIVWRLYD